MGRTRITSIRKKASGTSRQVAKVNASQVPNPNGETAGTSTAESSRPTKRRRTAAPKTKKVPKQTARQRDQLAKQELMRTFFDVLPLDIISEIFGYLHPRDLLRLSRMNKALRKLLTSRSSIFIWKRSRSTVYGLPECPQDQTEMQWAQLIFEKDCMVCWNHHNVRKADWALRIRACVSCLADFRVFRSRTYESFTHVTREELDDALKLLPYSEVHLTGSFGKTYSRVAIRNTLEQLEHLNLRVIAKIEGSEKDLEDFQRTKQKEAALIMSTAQRVSKWSSIYNSGPAALKGHLLQALRDSVKAKLLAQGHDTRDVHRATWEIKTPVEDLEAEWRQNQAMYEALVDRARERRVHWQRQHLLSQRRGVVYGLFAEYKISMGKDLDPMTPRDSEMICDLPPFFEVINNPTDAPVNRSDFDDAMEALPGLLDEWKRRIKIQLLRKLAATLGFVLPEDPDDPQMTIELERLEKPSSVFLCTGLSPIHRAALTFHDLPNHPCFWHSVKEGERTVTGSVSCLEVNRLSSQSADSVVKTIGLDTSTARIADMDAEDARFYCEQCPPSVRTALPWRLCAIHHLERPGVSETSNWVKINPEVTAAIIGQENSPLSTGRYPRIICQHCSPTYGRTYLNLPYFKDHLRLCHDRELTRQEIIPDKGMPAEPVRIKQRKGRKLASQSLPTSANPDTTELFNCILCPEEPSFLLEAFCQHVSIVHKDQAISANDYSAMTVFLAA